MQIPLIGAQWKCRRGKMQENWINGRSMWKWNRELLWSFVIENRHSWILFLHWDLYLMIIYFRLDKIYVFLENTFYNSPRDFLILLGVFFSSFFFFGFAEQFLLLNCRFCWLQHFLLMFLTLGCLHATSCSYPRRQTATSNPLVNASVSLWAWRFRINFQTDSNQLCHRQEILNKFTFAL